MSKLALLATQQAVAGHMDKIMKHFKEGAKVTVLVRRPNAPEQDFMMTNDDLSEVQKAVDRRAAAGETP